MAESAPLALVDALHALLLRPAADASVVDEALVRIDVMRRHPTEAFAFGVPKLVEALAHWFLVTGGDAVTEALGGWLDTMDPAATAGVDRRLLREAQLLCPRLIPFAATPRPVEDEREIARFAPFVEALLRALADNAALGPREVWCERVRDLLHGPEVVDQYTSLPWALSAFGRSRFLHDAAEDLEEIATRLATAFALGPNVEIRSLDLNVIFFVTVVDVIADPATEITRATLQERHPEIDGVEVGDEVGLQDPERTRALRTAVLRALGA